MLYRMSRNLWDPWRQLRQFEREFSRLVGEFEPDRRRAGAFPPVNVRTGSDEVIVTAELPGVDPASLDVTAVRNSLTIRGERMCEEPPEGATWHRRECRGGSFARTVELPFAVESEHVEATCNDGLLRVKLQRPEKERPRKIAVEVG